MAAGDYSYRVCQCNASNPKYEQSLFDANNKIIDLEEQLSLATELLRECLKEGTFGVRQNTFYKRAIEFLSTIDKGQMTKE